MTINEGGLEFAQRHVKMVNRITEDFTNNTEHAERLLDLMEERFAIISQSFARQFFLFALTFFHGKNLSTLSKRERGIGWVASEVIALVERIAGERESKAPWSSMLSIPPARDTLYEELMNVPHEIQDTLIKLNEKFNSDPDAVIEQAEKIPSKNYAALEQFFYLLYQGKLFGSVTEDALCAMGGIFDYYFHDEDCLGKLTIPRVFRRSYLNAPVPSLKVIGREALSEQQLRCALIASATSQGCEELEPSMPIRGFAKHFAYMCVHWDIDPNDVSVDTKAHLLRSIDFLAGIPEFENIVNTVSGHKNCNYTSAFMSYTAPELDKLDGDYSPEEKIKFFCAIADTLYARDKKNGVVFTGDVYGLDSVVAVLRWEQFLPAVVNAYNGANARIDDVPMGLVLSTIDQSVFDSQLRDGDILMERAKKSATPSRATASAKRTWGWHEGRAVSNAEDAAERFNTVFTWAKKVVLGKFVETEYNRALNSEVHEWEPTVSFIEAITAPDFSAFSPAPHLREKWNKGQEAHVLELLDSWR